MITGDRHFAPIIGGKYMEYYKKQGKSIYNYYFSMAFI